jgi:hypothetical protein
VFSVSENMSYEHRIGSWILKLKTWIEEWRVMNFCLREEYFAIFEVLTNLICALNQIAPAHIDGNPRLQFLRSVKGSKLC